MTEFFAEKILDALTGVEWLDKTAGIVKPVTLPIKGTGGMIDKTFPVSCQLNYLECTQKGRYLDLVPDSSKKSVLYFEDGGTSFTPTSSRYIEAESRLRLVCWLNLAKMGQPACTLSALAVSQLLAVIPDRLPDESPYFGIRFRISDELIKDNGIFSRYSYDEKATQYLMYPYDYFALNIIVNYRIVKDCVEPIETNPEFCAP